MYIPQGSVFLPSQRKVEMDFTHSISPSQSEKSANLEKLKDEFLVCIYRKNISLWILGVSLTLSTPGITSIVMLHDPGSTLGPILVPIICLTVLGLIVWAGSSSLLFYQNLAKEKIERIQQILSDHPGMLETLPDQIGENIREL